MQFEELAADFDGDDFGIGEFGSETSLPQSLVGLLGDELCQFVGHKAVSGNDKIVPVHRAVTFSGRCGNLP